MNNFFFKSVFRDASKVIGRGDLIFFLITTIFFFRTTKPPGGSLSDGMSTMSKSFLFVIRSIMKYHLLATAIKRREILVIFNELRCCLLTLRELESSQPSRWTRGVEFWRGLVIFSREQVTTNFRVFTNHMHFVYQIIGVCP